MKWFENKEIEVISWPPQSPDLSPIENIWAFIKHKVWENHKLISTKNGLWDFLQQLWWSIELKEICKNCFESLPLRIEEVIDQKGGATSY